MNKPIPACELVVKQPSNGERILFITPHSHDAAEWVRQNAPAYGAYYLVAGMTFSTLLVAEGYDVAEVIRYLEGYNSA